MQIKHQIHSFSCFVSQVSCCENYHFVKTTTKYLARWTQDRRMSPPIDFISSILLHFAYKLKILKKQITSRKLMVINFSVMNCPSSTSNKQIVKWKLLLRHQPSGSAFFLSNTDLRNIVAAWSKLYVISASVDGGPRYQVCASPDPPLSPQSTLVDVSVLVLVIVIVLLIGMELHLMYLRNIIIWAYYEYISLAVYRQSHGSK
jgi:hypothetical protein